MLLKTGRGHAAVPAGSSSGYARKRIVFLSRRLPNYILNSKHFFRSILKKIGKLSFFFQRSWAETVISWLWDRFWTVGQGLWTKKERRPEMKDAQLQQQQQQQRRKRKVASSEKGRSSGSSGSSSPSTDGANGGRKRRRASSMSKQDRQAAAKLTRESIKPPIDPELEEEDRKPIPIGSDDQLVSGIFLCAFSALTYFQFL